MEMQLWLGKKETRPTSTRGVGARLQLQPIAKLAGGGQKNCPRSLALPPSLLLPLALAGIHELDRKREGKRNAELGREGAVEDKREGASGA